LESLRVYQERSQLLVSQGELDDDSILAGSIRMPSRRNDVHDTRVKESESPTFGREELNVDRAERDPAETWSGLPRNGGPEQEVFLEKIPKHIAPFGHRNRPSDERIRDSRCPLLLDFVIGRFL